MLYVVEVDMYHDLGDSTDQYHGFAGIFTEYESVFDHSQWTPVYEIPGDPCSMWIHVYDSDKLVRTERFEIADRSYALSRKQYENYTLERTSTEILNKGTKWEYEYTLYFLKLKEGVANG